MAKTSAEKLVGFLTLSNNYRYHGEIQHKEPHGYGTFLYANLDKYTGHCRLGQADGFGKYTWHENSNVQYTGYFSSGRFHGIGTLETRTHITKGQWRFDRKHGYFLTTDIVRQTTTREMWIKNKLQLQESIQYIPIEALQTTKLNPIKQQKKLQKRYTPSNSKCIGCELKLKNATSVDCGHVCMCDECLLKCTTCPICRKPISKIIKLFVS